MNQITVYNLCCRYVHISVDKVNYFSFNALRRYFKCLFISQTPFGAKLQIIISVFKFSKLAKINIFSTADFFYCYWLIIHNISYAIELPLPLVKYFYTLATC